jgi:hypothetical protein
MNSTAKSRGVNSSLKTVHKPQDKQQDFNKIGPSSNVRPRGMNRKSPNREIRAKKEVAMKQKVDVKRTKKITIRNPLCTDKQTTKFVPTNEDP